MAGTDVSVVDRYGRWPLPGALTAIQPALDIGRFRTARGEVGMCTQIKDPGHHRDRPGEPAAVAIRVSAQYS